MNRQRLIQIVMISIAVMLFLGLLIYTIDYLFWRDSRNKKHLAKVFCECAEKKEVLEGGYEGTKDNFVYALGLNTCFAEEFAQYKGNMTDKMRENYIEDVSVRIFESCPNQADNVLTPKKNE